MSASFNSSICLVFGPQRKEVGVRLESPVSKVAARLLLEEKAAIPRSYSPPLKHVSTRVR